MGKKRKYKSVAIRDAQVVDVLRANYEPGNQRRSKRQVCRTIICRQFGISERTVYRCLKRLQEEKQEEFDKRQTMLDFGDE